MFPTIRSGPGKLPPSMKWSVGIKIGTGYALALLALLVIGATSYRSVNRLLETSEAVTYTHQVLNKIDDLLTELINIETSGRGYVITSDESFLAPYEAGRAAISGEIDAVRKLIVLDSMHDLLTQMEPLIQKRLAHAESVVALERSGNHEGAVQKIQSGEGQQVMQQIRQLADRMTATQSALLKTRTDESDASARATILTIIVGIAAAAVLLIIAAFLIIRSISTPLQQITSAAERIAAGDLDVAVDGKGRSDEVGVLAQAFARMTRSLQSMAKGAEEVAAGNLTVAIKPQSTKDVVGNALATMVQKLSSLIGQVQRSGIQVNTSATEIAATARQQQATASEIFSTTTEIGATSKEISATAKELVTTMKGIAEIAEETATLAGSGQSGLARMQSTMQQIMDASGSVNTRLAVLSEKATNINTVVTTIAKVADQTNLLSLNAAIEAEKAGEYGRGFSVVATEIRRLADQTAAATSDIELMVKEMQSAVSAGVMGMDKFSEEVRRGVDVVGQVSTQLTQIIEQVQTLTPGFETVNEGMQSQSLGAQQISEALAQLGEAAQQTVESLRQSNLAIEQLNEATSGLQQGVSRFKVEA